MSKPIYHIALLFFVPWALTLTSCSKNPTPSPTTKTNISTTSKAEKVYLFKKQKRAEIWSQDGLIRSVKLDKPLDQIPIGKFEAEKLVKILTNFNDLEAEGINKLFVFPNDSRIDGMLEPCFACPHSIAETYAQLEMEIFLSFKPKYIVK